MFFVPVEQFDLHGNGRIPVNQLKSQLSRNNHGVPDYAIHRIIALADKNQDDFITFPEFVRLVRLILKNLLSDFILVVTRDYDNYLSLKLIRIYTISSKVSSYPIESTLN